MSLTIPNFPSNPPICRKRESISIEEVEDAIDSLQSEIETLEDEIFEKNSELSDLLRASREAAPDAKEIAVGPSCRFCREYEPQELKLYCDECERKVKQFLQMGKTPAQICGTRSDLLAVVERMLPQAETAPTETLVTEIVAEVPT